ncbi:MAG: hypothetical protein HPY59_00265 [Anaerolineae bacterium]|nr:hypothetical protein [Anaerolineae bacterium]
MPTDTCAGCGAVYQNNLTCETVFDDFLALEFTDAAYGEVHLLTVACYMIQHGQYSDDALVWIEQQLRDHLEKGIPAEQIRQKAAKETRQDRHTWRVARRKEDKPQEKIPWSMTILDVALQYQDSESYRKLVRQWASITLSEMRPLLPDPK